jgi:hypothetical protein
MQMARACLDFVRVCIFNPMDEVAMVIEGMAISKACGLQCPARAVLQL